MDFLAMNMNTIPASMIASTVHPARWKYEDSTPRMIPMTRNDLAKTRPVIGQILLCFSLISLGALLLMDPECTPIPKRNGAIARRVTPASRYLRTLSPTEGRTLSTSGARYSLDPMNIAMTMTP